ncbi:MULTISPECIES: 4'-phosphopantetheinyl transferase family protein [Alphaproteobacteria]|uniref:Uncharacterized protein n=2 Tax=Alphaproteobacteria TaxID=28211 RepID=A0A512HN44_9HYPH|nr:MULTISPECIES: 4'-phosphopantetheinyl transferase superfamily protein [Alphaproteobacteria]GEO86863.1 hypothetical protein RNA01_37950 [Ciceribacter naphthalenivorans]GLR24007.1 hypothetical protein GCM10007920_38010 [Ciceribacter naphthalenivorans]GLT06863.1 hypothetical protein GCM10007926_38010 [Sphingomonas psychrolutea]
MTGRASTSAVAIDLWTWDLDRPPAVVANFAALLAPDETARASRFVMARDAGRYIVARAGLRVILGSRLGIAPAELAFLYNDFGKPRLAPCDMALRHFNLSHSGALAMLAISDRFPLGIDIEEAKPLKEDIAGYFFSTRECASLDRLPRSGYLNAFYRCWTRKEAFVKAHGDGLTIALDAFDVSVGAKATLDLGRLDGEASRSGRWRLFNIKTPVGFQGALVALTGGVPVQLRYHRWSGDDVPRESLSCAAARPGYSGLPLHQNDDTRPASA